MKTITPTEEYWDLLITEEEAEQEHEALRGRSKATAAPPEKLGRANATRKKNNI